MMDRDPVKASVRQHFWEWLFWPALLNTLVVLFGTLFFANLLGWLLAYFSSTSSPRQQRWIRSWIYLPLALPGYVIATSYLTLFASHSSLGLSLASWGLGLDFKGLWSVIFCLSLSLFPYAFFEYQEALETQSRRASEVISVFQISRWPALRWIWWKGLWPWMLQASWYIGLEVLADFAVFSLLNVDSLVTILFKVWFQLFDRSLAISFATVLFVSVSLVFLTVEWSRWRRVFSALGYAVARPAVSSPRFQVLTMAFSVILLLLIVVIPISALLNSLMSSNTLEALTWTTLWNEAGLPLVGTMVLGAGTASVLLIAGVVTAQILRQQKVHSRQLFKATLSLGYNLSGAIIAILTYPLAVHIGLTNHWIPLTLALMFRYFGVSFRAFATSLERLTQSQMEVLVSFRVPIAKRIRLVLWPYFRVSAGAVFLLTFFDVIKELPITLMYRPIGSSFLSTKVFEYTQEGQYAQAALPALLMAGLGLAVMTGVLRAQS